MNKRFVGAAAACGAPQADPQQVEHALKKACAPANRSLLLRKFTVNEVYNIITKRIPAKSSKDIYGISMKLLNWSAGTIAPILTELFNQYIDDGKCPDSLKISKVSPIFKGKGKRQDIDGYRPVSIIPAIAKVMENGISSRLLEYLLSVQALSDRQYAYREGRSTTSLARKVVRCIIDARERKHQVAVLCCDLSRAFDVADHKILTVKMRHYGIVNKALSLLTGFLHGRSQIVVGDRGNEKSDSMTTIMGVAQGSAVSNILFSLLLNDLPDAITEAEVMMYADDVAAVVTAPSTEKLEQKLNITTAQLAEWFKNNGLVLNLQKTHFLQFDLSGRRTNNVTVEINGCKIEQSASTNFLGFELDRGLTWNSHIHKVCGRLGGACFALRRLSRFLPREVVRSCYFATVHSLLQYGAELWGRGADTDRVFRLQKQAVRAVARLPRDTSVKPYFKSLKILTLPGIVIYQVAIYVRLNLDSYSKIGESHQYNTRRSGRLAAVKRSLTKSEKSTHIMGPAVYNRLPENVVEASSMTVFKSRLKFWLIDQAFYSYAEFLTKIPLK